MRDRIYFLKVVELWTNCNWIFCFSLFVYSHMFLSWKVFFFVVWFICGKFTQNRKICRKRNKHLFCRVHKFIRNNISNNICRGKLNTQDWGKNYLIRQPICSFRKKNSNSACVRLPWDFRNIIFRKKIPLKANPWQKQTQVRFYGFLLAKMILQFARLLGRSQKPETSKQTLKFRNSQSKCSKTSEY